MRRACRTALPVLASAGAALFAVARADAGAPPADTTSIREYRTGHAFALAKPNAQLLLGANTRCMLGWCKLAIARAYAFGLYADEAALRAAAARAPGAPSRAAALLDAVEAGAGSASLVLVIARAIDGEHLAHGFGTSVRARHRALLAARGAPPPAPAAAAQLAALCAGFSGESMKVGDEVELAWARGVLSLSINGRRVPRADITDAALARALFNVYAGDEPAPVSKRARDTFERNLASLATAPAPPGADFKGAVAATVLAEHATRVK
jgi:hypothetical protein